MKKSTQPDLASETPDLEPPTLIAEVAASTRSTEGRPELTIISADELTLVRRRAGKGFYYVNGRGSRITDKETLARIRGLVIPPAYADVRIAVDPNAHIQAIGRDKDGRLQYRYHPHWDMIREERKAERLAKVLQVLARIRAAVARDIALREPTQAKALALAVALIDQSFLRVGNECYAQMKGGRGTATLLKRDAKINGDRIDLNFWGKSGKRIAVSIEDAVLATALAEINALRGRRLLQYVATDGKVRPISAAAINTYLCDCAEEDISAKDLRMLGANALAMEAFASLVPEKSEAKRRRQIAEVLRGVADKLANTPAVVRKSYVHSRVVDSFTTDALRSTYRAARTLKLKHRAEHALQRLFAPTIAAVGISGLAADQSSSSSPLSSGTTGSVSIPR